jgi:hypothetical protein
VQDSADYLSERIETVLPSEAKNTAFAGPDVDMGTVPSIVSAVVELLACRTAIAAAFGKICKTLRAVERTVLASPNPQPCPERQESTFSAFIFLPSISETSFNPRNLPFLAAPTAGVAEAEAAALSM